MNQEQLRKEAANVAIYKYYGTHIDKMAAFSSELESAYGYQMGFIAGAEWEAERERWKPINELDLSTPIVVQRWHRLWNCPITVWFNKDEESSYNWYEKSLTNKWPEEAFMPFYCDLPTPPKTSKK